MINIRENVEMIQGILFLQKPNIINKKYTTEELKELIKKLSLYNATGDNYISISQLLYHLKCIKVGYNLIGDVYYLY